MTITKDLLDAMPLDGNVRVATAEQLEAYVKAVTAGAMGRLSAKADPMKALGAELIVEGIMSKFMVAGQAVFCGQRFKHRGQACSDPEAGVALVRLHRP